MTSQIKSILIVSTLIVAGIGAYIASGDNNNDDSPITNQESTQNVSQESAPVSSSQTVTLAMVEERDSKDDCWTIISGNVYDITTYIPRHPGGDEILLACGADGTSLFTTRTDSEGQKIGSGTPHSSGAKNQLEALLVGKLEQ
jgi:cytochrome b involved in lipid metabolism